jgi:serine/threonine protein kinase
MLEMQELISGRYRLQQRLCRGGMSDVYLAYNELMHRE